MTYHLPPYLEKGNLFLGKFWLRWCTYVYHIDNVCVCVCFYVFFFTSFTSRNFWVGDVTFYFGMFLPTIFAGVTRRRFPGLPGTLPLTRM